MGDTDRRRLGVRQSRARFVVGVHSFGVVFIILSFCFLLHARADADRFKRGLNSRLFKLLQQQSRKSPPDVNAPGCTLLNSSHRRGHAGHPVRWGALPVSSASLAPTAFAAAAFAASVAATAFWPTTSGATGASARHGPATTLEDAWHYGCYRSDDSGGSMALPS